MGDGGENQHIDLSAGPSSTLCDAPKAVLFVQ
jgi:hypothetical protein